MTGQYHIGDYYIRLASGEADNIAGSSEDDESQGTGLQPSYSLFDRSRTNDAGEPFCIIASGTYEQCSQEQQRLEASVEA